MIRIKRIQILSFWYIYVVYTDVGYKCQVMSIHVVAIIPSFIILSAQVCTLWQFSPRFSYCQLRCAHVLSCQAMKRHVKSWQSMSSNVKSCHGDYPLVSHIVSSGVHFNPKKRQNPESEFFGVELESKFILKKVVSMTAHVHTWADNIRNEGKIATKWTPELTIWEMKG